MRVEMLKPLRHRDYRLLWTGQSISLLGDGVGLVALSWQALALSNKAQGASTLALVLVARTVPLLALLLVGGAITDRLSRRLLMLVSDCARAVIMAVIAALAMTHALRVWHLIGLAALFGAADAFFFPASSAIIPELVQGDNLVRANSLDAATRPLMMRMTGPALGGLIVASSRSHGTAIAFALDSATFLFSTGCLILMRARSSPLHDRTSSITREIADGFRYTRSQAWIWATLMFAALAVMFFIGPFDVLVPVFAKLRLGGARDYGLIVAAMGLGGVVGAFVAPRVCRGRRVRRMYVIWAVAPLFFAGIAATHSVAPVMALTATLGFGFEIGQILWITLLQELVPGTVLGRVRSLDYFISFAFMPLSYAIVAPIASRIGVGTTIAYGGILASVSTIAFLLYPGVLNPDRPGYVAPPFEPHVFNK